RKAEWLQAHGLERTVSGQDQQICPGKLATVLLFDGPQEAARLVEVRVVRPAAQWSEPLRAFTGAATAIFDAVGACRMPAQADEERAVVPEVRGPPRLRGRHHLH